MFEKVVEIGLLFDFYGKLLSDKQQDAIEMYYIDDLSLSEIAEELDISRQGVHDALKRAEGRLYAFEEKLKLVEKFQNNKDRAKLILEYIEKIKIEDIKLHSTKIDKYINSIEAIVLEILEISQEVK